MPSQGSSSSPSKEDAVKDLLKKAKNDVWLSHIEENIKTKAFNGPLSSYKHKDDLITIAGALLLSKDGTVIDLIMQISQPWFAGLLGGNQTSATTAMAAAASTSSQQQNMPLEHPATSSSSQALPPHFTHPPYFFGQHTHLASYGLHNPQYLPVHPHTD
ncbi:hypothetical protein BDR04DRAFT_1164574 [Suillus decipiens]|nr:hypothetical protein BDR04DRAFT_1164574 [Suillus decipiens]